MGTELAFGLPAAGALLVTAFRRHRPLALLCGGLLGAATVLVLLPFVPALSRSALGLSLPAPGRAFVVASAITLAMAVTLAPATVDRVSLLAAGLAGLAGLTAIALAPDPATIAVVVALLAAGHAALPGRRPFAARMRAPAFGLVLLAAATLLAHDGGPPMHARLAALAFVLGLIAIAGLVPFLPELEPAEAVPASAMAWTGFFGPAVAFDLLARVQPMLAPEAAPVHAALLVGIGLLNLLWGLAGAWLVEGEVAAWRYSFLADWGLALVGLGIVVGDGQRAAYLLLMGVVLVRLPLYLWARPVLLGRTEKHLGPSNLLLSAALAGIAPFAGFSARLLLLRGAMEIYWPLALVLAVAMLLWLGHSLRLAQSIGRPQGRAAIGVVLALAISVVLGVFPGIVLAAGGF